MEEHFSHMNGDHFLGSSLEYDANIVLKPFHLPVALCGHTCGSLVLPVLHALDWMESAQIVLFLFATAVKVDLILNVYQ